MNVDEVTHFAAANSLGTVSAVHPLPAGLENESQLVVTDRGRYVVRASRQRSVRQVEAEVSFVYELKALGFKVAPEFVPLRNQRHAITHGNEVVSAYRFIPGEISLQMSYDQFEELVSWMEILLQAERRISPTLLAARCSFPDAQSIRYRFTSLLERAPHLDIVPDSLRIPSQILSMTSPRGIHSDIHVKNLVWDETGRLCGVIDFDDCCVGTPMLEFATFARGACFIEADIDLGRLDYAWRMLGRHLSPDDAPPPASQLVAYLMLSCMYFAVAVNRPRPHTGVPALAERDILRTKSVIDRQHEIQEILRQ